MKAILTGATGLIGSEALTQCLKNDQIDSLIILSRRAIPHLDGNPKVKVMLMNDFTKYPDEVLGQLEGADIGIWCLGTFHGDRKVEIDYPRAFFDAITSTISYKSRSPDRPFRHVHLSGAIVEPDQDKTLWYFSEGRNARGQAETQIRDFDNSPKAQGKWRTYVVKPGYVLPPSTRISWLQTIMGYLMTGYYCVLNDHLALSMLDLGINGGEKRVLESKEIGDRGGELLRVAAK